MSVAERKGRILLALFDVLKNSPEGLPAKEAIALTREKITLDPSETGTYEDSGDEKFPKIARFATIPAVKAGWIIKQDGVWILTSQGESEAAQATDAESFYKKAYSLYKNWKSETQVDVPDADDSEEDVADATSLEETEDDAREKILEHIGKMPPLDFQQACAKLMEALGHKVQWISPPGPDGGLDFVAYTDPIGVSSRRIKGQAKRTQKKQDVDAVGAFISKLAKPDDVGVFIALGGFTGPAESLARADERRLVLIDGPDFLRLWIEHYQDLDEDAKELLRLRPIWHLVKPT